VSRARDIADLGQDKTTLSSYASTGVTSSEFDTLDGITSSTAELNKLDGVTADVTDLNRLDISTEGTSQASKVVTADSSGHVTLAGELRGPATFVIDPAVVGNNTGLLQVKGNLQVDGTTTTINSTTVEVDDKNIVLGSGAADSAAADGAGLTIDGASATMLYTHSTTSFDFNKPVNVTGNASVSGDLTVDTNTLKVDSSNNRVGIGTSGTPQDALHIVDSTTRQLRLEGNAPSQYFKETDGSADQNYQLRLDDGKFLIQTNNDAFSSASTKVAIDQSGNFGIGDTSPSEKLVVSDNTASQFASIIKNTHASGAGMKVFGATGTQYSFIVRDYTDNTNSLVVLGNGNVGIGTTSPSTLIHVNGSRASVGDPLAIIKATENDHTGIGLMAYGSNASHRNWLVAANVDVAGSFGIGYTANDSDVPSTANVTTALSIDSSGKVGIGTTSPSSYYYDTLTIDHTNSNGGITLKAGTTEISALAFADGTTGNEQYRGRILYYHNEDRLALGSAGDTHLHINSSGNVGIGTTASFGGSTTTHKYLSILNTNTTDNLDRPAVLELACSNKGNGVHVGKIDFWSDVDGGDDNVGTIICAQDGTTSNNVGGKFRFQTKADGGSIADRMVINENGDVLIGDSTTAAKFYVKSSGPNAHFWRTINSQTDELISAYSNYAVGANLVFRVMTSGTVYNDTNVFTTFPSDERLKKEIKETSPKLDKLLKLPIVSYYTTKNSNFKKMGVTAQDLEKVMPSLVDFVDVDENTPMVQKDDNGELLLNDEGKPYVLDKNGDKLSKIKYTKDSLLLFCAIKAIQELSDKVTTLENATN